jgi:hypothetical protein
MLCKWIICTVECVPSVVHLSVVSRPSTQSGTATMDTREHHTWGPEVFFRCALAFLGASMRLL